MRKHILRVGFFSARNGKGGVTNARVAVLSLIQGAYREMSRRTRQAYA